MERLKIFGILAIGLIFVITGCGTKQHAQITNPNGEKVYSSFHLGILPGPDNAVSTAVAQARLEQGAANAALTRALAKQIEEGDVATMAGQYIGVIVNQDPRKTAYVFHPSEGRIIEIDPGGGYQIIRVTAIPRHISVRFAGEKRNVRRRIYAETKTFNGIKTDFGARIES